jgi:hypothetical protein
MVSAILNPDPPVSQLRKPQIKRPHWERRLPTQFIIAATPSPNSLSIKVEIQTTDTAEVHGVSALLDCGATGIFIDSQFVKENQLNTRKLLYPIPVYNVDGTLNEVGSITEVVDMILHYKDHCECTPAAVSSLGHQKLILGYTWLKEHNPEINWQTQEVKLSCCPAKCHTCRQEVKKEIQEHKREAQRARLCRQGPNPLLVEELEDLENSEDQEESTEHQPESQDPHLTVPLYEPGD